MMPWVRNAHYSIAETLSQSQKPKNYSMKISDSYFSAVPHSEESPFVFRAAYQDRLCRSLLRLSEATEASLDTSLDEFKDRFSQLDINKRFSPALHYFFINFERSYLNNTVEGLVENLELFSRFSEKDYYAEDFQISTIYEDIYDPALPEMIQEQESAKGDSDSSIDILDVRGLNDTEMEKMILHTQEALAAIRDADRCFYREMESYVSRLKLFHSSFVTGVTGVSVFGAIYLKPPADTESYLPYFVEHLVHETSHYHLYAIMSADPILLNEKDKLYPSPLRKDLRPMSGLFHGAFVLSRMVRILGRLNKGDDLYHSTFQRSLSQFQEALITVKKYAELTDRGQFLLSSLEEAAEIPQ